MATSDQQSKQRLFVGSYTEDTESKGIYELAFNPHERTLLEVASNEDTVNPSFLLLHNGYLYSANELSDGGEICSFSLEDGTITLIDTYEASGEGTCYIATDPAGSHIYGANYVSGSIIGSEILPDGTFGKPVTTIQHYGSSVNPDRQEKAHVHTLSFIPGTSLAVAVDLGTDSLTRYGASDLGEFEETLRGVLSVPAGEGPRILDYHPHMPLVALVTELNNNVILFQSNPETHTWTPAATHSLLHPDNYKESLSAHVEFSHDGRHLYASTRGPNHIVLFDVLPDERLELKGFYSCGGDYPRHFSLSPDGKFIAVANQMSGDVVIFALDAETGEPTTELARFSVPQASCVIWA